MEKNELINILESINIDRLINMENIIKQEKTQELYKKLQDAKNNIVNGEEILETAQKNYYTYTKGAQWYNNFHEKEIEKQVEKNAKLLTKKFNDKKKEIKNNLKTFKIQQISYDNMDNLMRDNNDKILDYANNIDHFDSKGRVNERITYYQNENIEHYESHFNLIRRIRTVLLIVFAIFIFIYHKQYKNLYAWGTFFALVFLPTILNIIVYISQKIIELFTFLYSIFN